MFEYVCVCALVWSKKWIILNQKLMLDRHPILFQAVKRNSTHFDEFTAKMEKLVILMTGSNSFFFRARVFHDSHHVCFLDHAMRVYVCMFMYG